MLKKIVLVGLVLVVGACGEAGTPASSDVPPPDTSVGSPSTIATPTTSSPTSSSTSGSSTTSAPTTTTSQPSTSTTAPESASPESIVVIDGVVEGPGEIAVQLGDEAVFTVTADVADEVHVHGYDLSYELEANAPTEVRFMADVPGVFEVELEHAHLLLVEIAVAP